MTTLVWYTDGYWIEARVPIVTAIDPDGPSSISITIEPRPAYCDRGRFIAKCFSDPIDGMALDDQEGWPRYYFDLDVAKSEIEAWVNARLRTRP